MIDINSAKEKINIVDVIQNSGVTLSKHCQNYWSVCPFHSEKTASFSANQTKQIFYCFGCGAGGDVIDFVRKYHNLDFPGALQFLGIEETTPQNRQHIRSEKVKRNRDAKRKLYQDKIYDEFLTWVDQYKMYLMDWIEILNMSIPRLSWERIKELSELIKQKTVWEYHLYLIATVGNEDIIYDIYREKNRIK